MLLKIYEKILFLKNEQEIKKLKRVCKKVKNNKFNRELKSKEQLVDEIVCSRMISAFGVAGISKLSEEEYEHYKGKLRREAFEEVIVSKYS